MFLMWQPSPRVTLMYVCNESFKYFVPFVGYTVFQPNLAYNVDILSLNPYASSFCVHMNVPNS